MTANEASQLIDLLTQWRCLGWLYLARWSTLSTEPDFIAWVCFIDLASKASRKLFYDLPDSSEKSRETTIFVILSANSVYFVWHVLSGLVRVELALTSPESTLMRMRSMLLQRILKQIAFCKTSRSPPWWQADNHLSGKTLRAHEVFCAWKQQKLTTLKSIYYSRLNREYTSV